LHYQEAITSLYGLLVEDLNDNYLVRGSKRRSSPSSTIAIMSRAGIGGWFLPEPLLGPMLGSQSHSLIAVALRVIIVTRMTVMEERDDIIGNPVAIEGAMDQIPPKHHWKPEQAAPVARGLLCSPN